MQINLIGNEVVGVAPILLPALVAGKPTMLALFMLPAGEQKNVAHFAKEIVDLGWASQVVYIATSEVKLIVKGDTA